jgi:formylglycine-generating enzyme required for sulfatase activity
MANSPNTPPSYLDFEIEIGLGQGREYPLAARSPAGEARGVLHFPFDELMLENRLDKLKIALLRSAGKRRLILSPEEQAVQDFGAALFDALLSAEIRSRYDVSCEQARQQDKGLRIKLRIQPPELAALPWEYLYDPRQGEYLCLSTQTPLIRYLEIPQPPLPLELLPPLRILGMCASPAGLPELEIEREKGRLEKATAPLQRRGRVEIHWLEGQTWRDLQRALRSGPWHVFHFVGHGRFDPVSGEGQLALADEAGRLCPLGATPLARLLADHRSLRLVFLNACEGARASPQDPFSSLSAVLVRRGLSAVLAMQYEITDRAAVELCQAFYEALVDNLPVDAAVSEARKAVSLSLPNSLEWGIPVLHLRAPDGVLFSVQNKVEDIGQKTDESRLAKDGREPVEPWKTTAPETRQPPAAEPADPNLLTVTLAPGMTMDFVRIPVGEFWMGSDKQKDVLADDNELPQHKVELPEYWMAKTPVTNAQYQAFVQASRHSAPQHWQGGKIPQDKEQHPVVYVKWEDATAFCQWASQASGQKIALPTEAQWEKAARGTDGWIYPWGDAAPDANRCNFEMDVKDTTPVGKYSPQGDSPYGCVDMAGNVWEWCADWFDEKEYSRRAKSQVHDPQGSASGSYRVLRGGAWVHNGRFVRCARRVRDTPSLVFNDVGFRPARSP